ncbi:hypothetical protein PAPYR_10483 [Paratrimastix pyriformis]|uniref:DNA2/NAM7 helicase-like C-terminal domain-containing protein n=1 Tax=Paratrimastix pyriformis TaxID=342808 RepID=A0ABQ8U5V7_9EUKA|nr:hypothetical protein PAPYR_10483 [Paratrimastix pyriformis]
MNPTAPPNPLPALTLPPRASPPAAAAENGCPATDMAILLTSTSQQVDVGVGAAVNPTRVTATTGTSQPGPDTTTGHLHGVGTASAVSITNTSTNTNTTTSTTTTNTTTTTTTTTGVLSTPSSTPTQSPLPPATPAPSSAFFTLLDTQYRMHPALCLFPSLRFYGGRIQSGADLLVQVPRLTILPARGWFPWPRPDFPMVFITSCACCAEEGRARSRSRTPTGDEASGSDRDDLAADLTPSPSPALGPTPPPSSTPGRPTGHCRCDHEQSSGSSFTNPHEAQVVAQVVALLMCEPVQGANSNGGPEAARQKERLGLEACDIGVITPYARQTGGPIHNFSHCDTAFTRLACSLPIPERGRVYLFIICRTNPRTASFSRSSDDFLMAWSRPMMQSGGSIATLHEIEIGAFVMTRQLQRAINAVLPPTGRTSRPLRVLDHDEDAAQGAGELEIKTVDGYQVRVYAMPTQKMCINVALTRARRALVMVGCPHTLSHDPIWRDLLQWSRLNLPFHQPYPDGSDRYEALPPGPRHGGFRPRGFQPRRGERRPPRTVIPQANILSKVPRTHKGCPECPRPLPPISSDAVGTPTGRLKKNLLTANPTGIQGNSQSSRDDQAAYYWTRAGKDGL